ncbi:hypothetical protein ES703_49322 [subsurface metagenome]
MVVLWASVVAEVSGFRGGAAYLSLFLQPAISLMLRSLREHHAPCSNPTSQATGQRTPETHLLPNTLAPTGGRSLILSEIRASKVCRSGAKPLDLPGAPLRPPAPPTKHPTQAISSTARWDISLRGSPGETSRQPRGKTTLSDLVTITCRGGDLKRPASGSS